MMKIRIAKENADYIIAFCPFHNDQHHPNLMINKTGRYAGRYICWACGAKGFATEFDIDYWPDLEEIPPRTAPATHIDWEAKIKELRAFDKGLEGAEKLERLRQEWGLGDIDPLWQLNVGWNGWAYTFAVYDGSGKPIGIQVRDLNGTKQMMRHSRTGIFIPQKLLRETLEGGTVFITEGVSDLACLLDMKYDGIGRFNATQNSEYVVQFFEKLQPKQIIVIPDRDEAGLKGALKFMSALHDRISLWDKKPMMDVLLVDAPYKDLRDWYNRDRDSLEMALRRIIW